jgi:hypothetical protein
MKATIRNAVALATLLALGGFSAAAQSRNTPVGPTWDCLLSGSGQQGIAFLTFSNDFTFTGYQLLAGKQNAASSVGEEGRNIGGGVDRGISVDGSAPSGGGGTTLFGFGFIDGPWRYDEKGRVVGYFVEAVDRVTTITTNQIITLRTNETYEWDYTQTPPVILTNFTVTISTNSAYVTNTTATTNAVSFSAKVVPGKNLNLVSSTPNGKVTYRGVPQKPLQTPITGSWQGTKKKDGQSFLEFFSLLPTVVPNLFVTTNGTGPDFKFGGVSMVSVKKKSGFAFQTFTGLGTNDVPVDAEGNITGGTLSATIGSINYPKKGTKANTKGFEDPQIPITFQAVRQGL